MNFTLLSHLDLLSGRFESYNVIYLLIIYPEKETFVYLLCFEYVSEDIFVEERLKINITYVLFIDKYHVLGCLFTICCEVR